MSGDQDTEDDGVTSSPELEQENEIEESPR